MGLLSEGGRGPASGKTGKTILISPGAGGVGSIAIQIAKKVLGLKVIATANRPESEKWCTHLGADFLVKHSQPLEPQLESLGLDGSGSGSGKIDYILTGKLSNEILLEEYLPLMNPLGAIVSIDAPGTMTLSVNPHKPAFVPGVQFFTEFVFTRVLYGDAMEMSKHGEWLGICKKFFENGTLQSVIFGGGEGEENPQKNVLPFSAEGLREAQKRMEEGSAIGKVVLKTKMDESTDVEMKAAQGGVPDAGGSNLAALYDPNENFDGFDKAQEATGFLCPETKLFKRFKTKVDPAWIDYNGHMTESKYLFVFGQGTDALLHHIRITPEYVEEKKKSYYTVETHIQHLREIAEGQAITVETQLLKVDGKRVHLFHTMKKVEAPEAGLVLATAEQMLLHVDTEQGRACVNENAESVGKLEAIWEAHKSMDPPQGSARYVGAPRR